MQNPPSDAERWTARFDAAQALLSAPFVAFLFILTVVMLSVVIRRNL
jgi:hypothetical protein